MLKHIAGAVLVVTLACVAAAAGPPLFRAIQKGVIGWLESSPGITTGQPTNIPLAPTMTAEQLAAAKEALGQAAVNVPDPAPTPTLVPTLAPPPTQAATGGGSQTTGNKACDRAKNSLPQTQGAIAASFGIEVSRIQLYFEEDTCPSVVTGFKVLRGEEVRLNVPVGGCIDSYARASYGVAPVSGETFERRATSSWVSATEMTYRVVGCEKQR